MQDLLEHHFLHPEAVGRATEKTTAGHQGVGLTKEHLQTMLTAMVAASGGSGTVDVASLADSVFHKVGGHRDREERSAVP